MLFSGLPGGAAGTDGLMSVIAEPQVPPAAQRLRDQDSLRLGALPGGGSAAALVRVGLLTDPPRLVVVGGRMNAWVAVLEWLVWPDGSPRSPAPPSPVPAALLAELHPAYERHCGVGGATGGTTAPRSMALRSPSSRHAAWIHHDGHGESHHEQHRGEDEPSTGGREDERGDQPRRQDRLQRRT
jgi:hypothetical protein